MLDGVWLLFAALLGASPQDDAAAQALYEAMSERIERAASLRAEFAVTLSRDGQEFGSFNGVLKAKEGDRWTCDLTLVRRDWGEEERRSVTLQSDGRRIRVLEGPAEILEGMPEARELALLLRRCGVDSVLPLVSFADPRLAEFKDAERPRDAGSFWIGARERVAGRAAEVLDYRVKIPRRGALPQLCEVKVWVDRETKLPLKRTLTLNGLHCTETITLEVGADLPDTDFAFQTPHRLARAQAAQLSESVRLFTHFTGAAPESLDDLARKPADLDPDQFWPRGGFVLGAVPRDPWGRPYQIVLRAGRRSIVCLGADGREGGAGENEDIGVELRVGTGSAIGAPSGRLAKHFTARVEMLLLSAAARAYRETYSEFPRSEKELRERQPWMQVWGDGGWIPAGRELIDPWGDLYRLVFAEHLLRAQVTGPNALLKVEDLTDLERRSLDETALPRVRGSDRAAVAALLDRLGDDEFSARVKAQAELAARGTGILSLVEERFKREKDAEILHRLQTLRRELPKPAPAWKSELVPLRLLVLADHLRPHDLLVNEDRAINALRGYCHIQASFRSNDRDANGVNDFWTGDIAGLWGIVPKGGKEPIKMIAAVLAAADAAPLPEFATAKTSEPFPKGGYWYRVLKKDNSARPPEVYQLDALKAGGPKTHNPSRFGAVAYPGEHGISGMRTFIVNESGSVFWKDTHGEPVEEWPDPETLKQEWKLLK